MEGLHRSDSLDAWTLLSVTVGSAVLIMLLFQRKKRRRKSLPDGVIYPPHVPTWIPYLGSAIEMNKGHVRDFLRKYAKKLNSPVFTVTILGRKCLLMTTEYVGMVYQERPEIDSYSLGATFARNCLGFTDQEVVETYSDRAVLKRAHSFFPKHLLSRDSLECNIPVIQDILVQQLNGMTVTKEEWTQFRLYKFVERLVFKATVGAAICKSIVTEEVLTNFVAFDDGVPLMFAGAPSLLTKKSKVASKVLAEACRLNSEFLSQASGLVKDRVEHLPYSNPTHSKALVGLLFAALGNSVPAIFWTMSNLLEDPVAYEACKEQVYSVKKHQGDVWTLEQLDQLTLLQSAFLESVRLFQTMFIVREAVEDFVLAGPKGKGAPVKYLVEKGTRIMSYGNYMHYDPDLYEDPETFKYDRFVDPNGKSKNGTLLSQSFRAFGGGLHLCPGRKLIGYEARALLAMMLLKLDMEWVEGEKRPEIDLSKQGIDVNRPERDPTMQIRLRST